MPRSAASMIARSRQPHCPTIARRKTAANLSCAEPTRHLAARYRYLDHRETGAIESEISRPHFFTVRNERADGCKRYRQAGLGKALPSRRRGPSSGSRCHAHLAASAGARCSEMAPRRREPWLATALSRRCSTERHRRANAAVTLSQPDPTFTRLKKHTPVSPECLTECGRYRPFANARRRHKLAGL